MGLEDQVNQNQGDQGGAQGGADQVPGWISGLPDDLKTNETFTGFKTVGDFAKHHLETAGKVTDLEGKLAGAIVKPGDDATDEQRAAFRQAIGVPEKPEDYKLERPDDIPVNEGMEAWFRSEAHAADISQEAAQKLYNAWNTKLSQAREAAKTSCVDTLRGEWKDSYDANLEITKRAAKQFGGDDIMTFFEETGLGNDPVMFRTFLNIGKAMMEDSTFRKQGEGGPAVTNPGEFSYPSMDNR